MKKLSNTESKLKKSVAYKEKRVNKYRLGKLSKIDNLCYFHINSFISSF